MEDRTFGALPVPAGQRLESRPIGHRRWRHSAAFIAQLAGQISERRQDRLHHWKRPQAVGAAYVRARDQRAGRRILAIV